MSSAACRTADPGTNSGGCSAINAMIYNRGAPDDYDEWERLGNAGWSFANVKPYMDKAESFDHSPRSALTNKELADHGRKGPWQTGYSHLLDLSNTFLDACAARSSPRKNLTIATGQIVTKIIFDDATPEPRAVGIEMAASKLSPIQYVVKARREVILSAGALQSPQLLKLSGVGPAAELQSHGIPLIKEIAAVGTNLADHLCGIICFECTAPSLQYLVADQEDAPEALKQNDLASGASAPDLEILIGPLSYLDHGRNIAPTSKNYFSIGPILLRPESRGTITLASSSPFDAPVIHANYLASQHDRDMMTYGMRLSRKIAQSAPFSPIFTSWYFPSNKVAAMSDSELLDVVKNHSETIYHPMCTLKMGPKNDPAAVVDANLKVHGIKGLRVVDASVFPKPVACHPCAPTVMVAEKAADLIKSDYLL
ncbi:hypothetical protein MRB53_041030 [Persea americana]|nr:hypothetical protein MRB53_041030 [Persea americana]